MSDKELNTEIELQWRRGELSYEAFDWWLRWICGI